VQRSLVSRLLFFSESGCKGKNFKAYPPNIFGSFFSFFLFPVFSNPLNKDKKSKTRKVLFLCESDCKDKENY
ncbi:hypothetical protein, partial [Bacteroides uniformis]|uniref:hypothetical protein n=2 Tax=Bacteroides uniformis TaxID=820 RepID=UPI0035651EA2